jgi:hypothetical protein
MKGTAVNAIQCFSYRCTVRSTTVLSSLTWGRLFGGPLFTYSR